MIPEDERGEFYCLFFPSNIICLRLHSSAEIVGKTDSQIGWKEMILEIQNVPVDTFRFILQTLFVVISLLR